VSDQHDDQRDDGRDDQAEVERKAEDFRRRLARNWVTFASLQRWREEHGGDEDW
jgi:hypothetical protein